jgi:sulfotransferase 6B1
MSDELKMRRRREDVLRKGKAFVRQGTRAIVRRRSLPEDYVARPPVLAHSFAKSGTHLLAQILGTLPGLESYGTFVANFPSVTLRERSQPTMMRKAGQLVPGELACGHLFWDAGYRAIFERLNVVSFFIYRDLRDVVVSEAHYLTEMARWHRMHGQFVALPSWEERISFSILGDRYQPVKNYYPHVGERFRRYIDWLDDDSTVSLRFEDLRGDRTEQTVRTIVEAWAARTPDVDDVDGLVAAALAGMKPKRSHTFRKGKAGGWRDAFTDRHREQMEEVAGDLLDKLGYRWESGS